MTEQEKVASVKLANKLGFLTHCVASGKTEKQASAMLNSAMAKNQKFEKIASLIREGLSAK